MDKKALSLTHTSKETHAHIHTDEHVFRHTVRHRKKNGVATISRLLEIIGLFYISSLL